MAVRSQNVTTDLKYKEFAVHIDKSAASTQLLLCSSFDLQVVSVEAICTRDFAIAPADIDIGVVGDADAFIADAEADDLLVATLDAGDVVDLTGIINSTNYPDNIIPANTALLVTNTAVANEGEFAIRLVAEVVNADPLAAALP